MANGIASLAPQQNPMMGAAPPQMPPQGAPGQEDPEALLQQIAASGASPEEIEAGTLSSLQEADPQLIESIMAELAGESLPAQVKQRLVEVIMQMLKSPENYEALLQQAINEGLPAELFPPTYDVETLSALRFVIAQIPTEEESSQVQGFRDGGPVSMKPVAKFLQEQGRYGDTVLAHISPEEAALLKARGGSGTINPVTGLPEYFKKALKKIGKAVKKVVSSPIGKALVAVGAVMLAAPTGGASLGALGGGGILGSIGSGLASVATSPAGISALATTGVQMARGKSFSEAAKDGLKVGAAVGIGASLLGGGIGSSFGNIGGANMGPQMPITSQIGRAAGTVWDTISSPFSGGVSSPKIFGMGLKDALGVGTALYGAYAAYDSAKDAKAKTDQEQQAQQDVVDQITNPVEPNPVIPGGVESPVITPPPIDATNPFPVPPVTPPVDGTTPPGETIPPPPVDGTTPTPPGGTTPPPPGIDVPSFALPPSQYQGFDPFAFLNQQPGTGGGGTPTYGYQPMFPVPQPPSFQDFLAMYGGGGGQGIQSFANGGPVYMKTGGSAADAAFRAKQNAAIHAAAFSNKPQAYYNAAGKQISKAEWEANQARMKAENDAMRQRTQQFQTSQAEAKRISDFNKMMAEKENQRRIEAAKQDAAAKAQQAAAAKAAQEREAARIASEQRAKQAAAEKAAQEAAAARAAAPAPVPQAPAPVPQAPAPVPPPPAPVPEAPGGIATLPEAPPIPQAPPVAPQVPQSPAAPDFQIPPTAAMPMPQQPEAPVQIPQMPVFQQPEAPVQIPQMPVFQQPEAPAPMPPDNFGIPQPQVQPLPYIPPNTFYSPIDFGNPGSISFNPAPGLYSGTVPSSFNQGGIAAVAPSRFNKGGASRFYPRKTGPINGPGTGTSDSIPAMLSDGEFVFTARAVRGAGNGSRLEGAKKMYQMMKSLERKSR